MTNLANKLQLYVSGVSTRALHGLGGPWAVMGWAGPKNLEFSNRPGQNIDRLCWAGHEI